MQITKSEDESTMLTIIIITVVVTCVVFLLAMIMLFQYMKVRKSDVMRFRCQHATEQLEPVASFHYLQLKAHLAANPDPSTGNPNQLDGDLPTAEVPWWLDLILGLLILETQI